MRHLFFAALLGLTALGFGQATPVGSWKYDTASMKIEPNAKMKKTLQDPKTGPQAKASLAKLQKNLAATLATIKLNFKADKTFMITLTKANQKATGTWGLYGTNLRVVMTDASQPTPKMEFAKGGKRIHTTFSDPGFGTAKIDMVRG